MKSSKWASPLSDGGQQCEKRSEGVVERQCLAVDVSAQDFPDNYFIMATLQLAC